jgi:uncharacterized protein (DUF1330 family)
MAAYIVLDIDVQDSDRYEDYKKLAPKSIAEYGGRYLARGGRTEILEGEWIPKRLVILEFPTLQRAKDWYDSLEYRKARDLRQVVAKSNMVVIDAP